MYKENSEVHARINGPQHNQEGDVGILVELAANHGNGGRTGFNILMGLARAFAQKRRQWLRVVKAGVVGHYECCRWAIAGRKGEEGGKRGQYKGTRRQKLCAQWESKSKSRK